MSVRRPLADPTTAGLADRLVAAAEVFGQKRLGHRIKRKAVLRPREAVPFVVEEHVRYRDILGIHRLDDLIRLQLLHARIVGALGDQQRTLDLVHERQRRPFAVSLDTG